MHLLNDKWSREYYGISHLGKFSLKSLWVTVERVGNAAKLVEWYPGCQFHPKETWHRLVADAKKVGEAKMLEGGML